jgi:hypothetical protein
VSRFAVCDWDNMIECDSGDNYKLAKLLHASWWFLFKGVQFIDVFFNEFQNIIKNAHVFMDLSRIKYTVNCIALEHFENASRVPFPI